MFVCPYFRAPANYKIIINTKILTLTLYSGNNIVKTYPVAVGKPNTRYLHQIILIYVQALKIE